HCCVCSIPSTESSVVLGGHLRSRCTRDRFPRGAPEPVPHSLVCLDGGRASRPGFPVRRSGHPPPFRPDAQIAANERFVIAAQSRGLRTCRRSGPCDRSFLLSFGLAP